MLRQLFEHLTLLFDVKPSVIVYVIFVFMVFFFPTSSSSYLFNGDDVRKELSVYFFLVPGSILFDYGALAGIAIPIELRLSEIPGGHYGATKSVYVSIIR